jgi:hypothetical protein
MNTLQRPSAEFTGTVGGLALILQVPKYNDLEYLFVNYSARAPVRHL